ncbi:exodeoxyribonuclease VII small subunit [Pseudoclavibacter chungangensis]|uniref:Exodeoxyribonuclease 7 small subunit n=1 Tax=Pseudoclavibacter chungangensis TaxID=587635 RepID=A0A7J5BU86_9MICO|nr:exodeoxyribonuclease VII small subunit [Pseudoclavibacter chungangensis]KAB1657916.1 exodeoxyribonuclease VII small subunit [Pseudoclavibacter chungangensis]NYJ65938.1 exodeoxyribonuclease VII small subunit [Pseudoclavibacter chungangensis]
MAARTPVPSPDAAANADVAELSYEDARDELVRVVTELEQGSQTLEASLALWERGEALADRCEQWLVGARQRLEAARRTSDTDADDASDDRA